MYITTHTNHVPCGEMILTNINRNRNAGVSSSQNVTRKQTGLARRMIFRKVLFFIFEQHGDQTHYDTDTVVIVPHAFTKNTFSKEKTLPCAETLVQSRLWWVLYYK